jgi:hypothetical protein
MSLRLAWVVVLLAAVTLSAADQAPARDAAATAAPAGIIRGVVIAADTGRPIRGADIRVEGGNLPRFEPR